MVILTRIRNMFSGSLKQMTLKFKQMEAHGYGEMVPQVKKEVKFFAVHAMKAYSFLTLALDRDEWQTSCSSHFTQRKNAGTIWIRGRVCPRAWLDILEKRKSSFPYRIRTLDRPACSPIIRPTILLWSLIPQDWFYWLYSWKHDIYGIFEVW